MKKVVCFLNKFLKINTINIFNENHHYHIQCIPLIEILWLRSGEGRSAAVPTHKEGCGQRVPRIEIDPQNDRSLKQRRISETYIASLYYEYKLEIIYINKITR